MTRAGSDCELGHPSVAAWTPLLALLVLAVVPMALPHLRSAGSNLLVFAQVLELLQLLELCWIPAAPAVKWHLLFHPPSSCLVLLALQHSYYMFIRPVHWLFSHFGTWLLCNSLPSCSGKASLTSLDLPSSYKSE